MYCVRNDCNNKILSLLSTRYAVLEITKINTVITLISAAPSIKSRNLNKSHILLSKFWPKFREKLIRAASLISVSTVFLWYQVFLPTSHSSLTNSPINPFQDPFLFIDPNFLSFGSFKTKVKFKDLWKEMDKNWKLELV